MVLRPSCSSRNLLPVTVPAPPRNLSVATMASSAFSWLVAAVNATCRVWATLATLSGHAQGTWSRPVEPTLNQVKGLSTLLPGEHWRDDQLHADIHHSRPCGHAVAEHRPRCGGRSGQRWHGDPGRHAIVDPVSYTHLRA